MEVKTKKRIESVLNEAIELAQGGVDEYEAARTALTAQTSDVLIELAVAAVVDVVRRRSRAEVLAVERQSASSTRRRREQAWKTPEFFAEQAERDARFAAHLRGITDTYVKAMKIEWTAILLGSDFALADGRRVTWGEATVGQHEERVAMFQRNVLANAEGAARHLHALEVLNSAGRETLNDLMGFAA